MAQLVTTQVYDLYGNIDENCSQQNMWMKLGSP